MTEYPYMISNNKILPIIEKLQTAAKPSKFTYEFLKNMGFSSSNDRAIIPLLKKLGFLTDDGTPTVYYDQLRDKTQFKSTLAVRIKDLYSELYTINTTIHSDSDNNIKGAISRVTGGDQNSVNRVFNTFKALCTIADFNFIETNPIEPESFTEKLVPQNTIDQDTTKPRGPLSNRKNEFHYNIQIHLPATTDISVYNAIFKSLKDNLLI